MNEYQIERSVLIRDCQVGIYQAFVTGVASFALSMLNGKQTANMHPLREKRRFKNRPLHEFNIY